MDDLDPLVVLSFTVILLGLGIIGLSTWVIVLLVVVRSVRDERNQVQADFATCAADRDGWRDVAKRALLVAQIGRNATRRAASLVTQVSKDHDPIS